MLAMLRLWSLLLLLNSVLATSERNLDRSQSIVTSQPDKLTLSPTNELSDDDDDYYSDNEQSDSIDSDYAASKYKYSNWIRITPTPSPSASASPFPSPTIPTSSSEATQHLKRVPRHPQHLLNDNRVDGDAAFDEVSFILLRWVANTSWNS